MLMVRPKIASGSGDEHELADVVTGREILLGLMDLGEGVGAGDGWGQASGTGVLDEPTELLRGVHRRSDQRSLLQVQHAQVDLHGRAGDGAAGDQAPARAERPQYRSEVAAPPTTSAMTAKGPASASWVSSGATSRTSTWDAPACCTAPRLARSSLPVAVP